MLFLKERNSGINVVCHISNCKFYENEYCNAPSLEVNAKNGYSATSSNEALCSTFEPK